jgi:hypothetical protein
MKAKAKAPATTKAVAKAPTGNALEGKIDNMEWTLFDRFLY